MNDHNLDYLLPQSDSDHWDPMVQRILNQTVYAPSNLNLKPLWSQIFRLAMPAIAAAIITNVVVWGFALKTNRTNSITNQAITSSESENHLLNLAIQSGIPTTRQIYTLLGGNNESVNP